MELIRAGFGSQVDVNGTVKLFERESAIILWCNPEPAIHMVENY